MSNSDIRGHKSHFMKATFFIFLVILFGQSLAQSPDQDIIATSKGNLTIRPIKHAALVLTWDNKTVYVDPDGGAKAFEGISAPDLILITDIHGDHFNLATLQAINTTNAMIVVPQVVADKLPDDLKSKAVVLNNDKSTDQKGISITAIPMYNLPEVAGSKHTKGRGNGYVVTFGGKKVYISGDTSGIPEMRGLKNIDVAFVCMNLPYTMDVKEAAAAVLDFKPGIVYPYHYRGQNGLSDVEAFKKTVNDSNPGIKVVLKNWYPN